MNVFSARPTADAQGQATYGMANLRKERIGLPCIVFIPQKDAARHDLRVKVAPQQDCAVYPTRSRFASSEDRAKSRGPAHATSFRPRMRPDQMSSYPLRPFALAEGRGLSAADERLLARWIQANLRVLVDDWDGRIAYTEDALADVMLLLTHASSET